MRDAIASLGRGEYVDPSGKIFIDWCKEWYEIYKKPKIKTNTKEKYLTSIKRLSNADISNMKLKDISQEIIQKYYNKLICKYAEETIKATHSLINGALEKAEEIKLIIKNPARNVIIPQDDEETEIKALTNEQYEKFMSELSKRSHYYMFVLFMSNTGLRPGEAIGLNREDLDVKVKTIHVNKTCVPKLKNIQKSTKTQTSKRLVPIPDGTIKLLKQYMLKQKNQKNSDPLFQTIAGTRLNARNVLRQLKEIGKDMDCEWINLHTLRHTYASRLFKEKVDIKVISSLLGHKKVSTTYDIYIHFINNVVEDSVQVLNSDVKIPEALPQINCNKKDNITKLRKASNN